MMIKTGKEIQSEINNYQNLTERDRMDNLYTGLEKVEFVDLTDLFIFLDGILYDAYIFSSCPNCGNEEAESHYCPKCKARFAEADESYWFAVKLDKRIKSLKEKVKNEKLNSNNRRKHTKE